MRTKLQSSAALAALLVAGVLLRDASGASSGGLIAFVRLVPGSEASRVFVVRPRGKPRRLALGVTGPRTPAWSPDGRRIAFAAGEQGQGELYIATRVRPHPRRLTRNRVDDYGPAWSPDGRRLLFVRSSQSGTSSSVWVMNADGGGARRLTRGASDLQPSWSSDNRWIAFVRIDPKTRRVAIWVIRPDGSRRHQILTGIENATQPMWSPTARRLLVTDGRTLITADLDGSHSTTVVRLSPSGRGERIDPQPAWSPDGRAIVFVQLRGTRTRHADVWIVNADGSGLQRVTTSPGVDADPSWAR